MAKSKKVAQSKKATPKKNQAPTKKKTADKKQASKPPVIIKDRKGRVRSDAEINLLTSGKKNIGDGKKLTNIKKREASKNTSESKRSSTAKRESIVSKTEQVAKIQATLPKVVKQPKKQLSNTRKEINRVNSKKYRLNAKLKATKGKGSKSKKAEIKQEIAALEPKINELKTKREAIKKIVKLKTGITKDRRKLKAEIKKVNQLLDEAYYSGNMKEFQKLLDVKDDLVMAEDAIQEAVGETMKEANVSGYRAYSGEFADGFVESPNSPITVWQAQDEIETDLNSGEFDWFIVDQMLISADNDGMVREEMRQLRYYIEEDKKVTKGTPKIAVYYNRKSRAAKYLPA